MPISFVGSLPMASDNTTWHFANTARGFSLSTIGGAQAGDFAMLLYTNDTTGNGSAARLSVPTGWARPIDYRSGAKGFEAQWKFLTAGDLSGTTTWTTQADGDNTGWIGCWRGVDESAPINNWNHAHNGGHSSDVSVAVTADVCLVEAFCDWAANWPNAAWADGAGITRRYYSPNIRWEASMGVYEKNSVAAGTQSVGLGSFGTANYRAVIALKALQGDPLWVAQGSNSAMVMG